MNQPIEAIAYHGWGFDRHCWTSWKTRFANYQIPLTSFDRGYFGSAFSPSFIDGRYRILLVHSYGLHLCPIEQFKQADLLVIFSSFINFHPCEQREQRRSQLVLRQMIRDCQSHPEIVLNAFKENCGCLDVERLAKNLNHELLLADLKNLNICSMNLDMLKSIPQTIIFHGTGDRIVSFTKGQEMVEQLQDNANNFEIQDAGHALPFTHTQVCWNLLVEHLNCLLLL
ncbi:MAG: alpha/beta hydrolase [Leptolyngbyaceae cyanobacterium SL_7_1]|nr:alpha/beta hydrolase [Leptolyngbyaceae cyanobacterium SL_7_1]